MSPSAACVRALFRDEKAGPPRLAFAASYWALLQLPQEMPFYIDLMCKLGFEYFEVGLHAERIEPASRMLRENGLRLIGQGWANTFANAQPYIDLAASLGAVSMNMHLGHAFMSPGEAAELVMTCREYASRAGLPLTVETHRGRCTQDLLRTAEWLTLTPDTPFCLDVSHYITAGEGWGGHRPLFLEHLQPILNNAAMIHGRISDGESVQSVVSPAVENTFTAATVQIWTDAMERWLSRAEPGDILVFEPELGPPPYAALDAQGKEISDRWEQSAKIAELAQQAWEIAQTAYFASGRKV